MSTKKLGQEPAFPVCSQAFSTVIGRGHEPIGMSKRFYAACAAMQGILSDKENQVIDGNLASVEQIINVSYVLADELLKQEEQQ